MHGDLEGSSPDATAPDTATEATAAPDTGSTEVASSVAEGQSEDAEEAGQPTPGDESAEDDGDDEDAATGEQTEEQKKLSRRERQRQREQERIDKAVAEAVAESKRQEAEQAEVAKRAADAKKAREQAAREFAEYIGDEGEPERLAQEVGDLYRQIRNDIATLTQDELDKIDGEIKSKESRIADITKARGFQDKIANNLWNGIEAQMLRPLSFPEFADQATKQRFLGAEGGIAGAWDVAREVIRSAVRAEADAEIATLKADHESEVKTLREEMRGWRVRAGAEEVADTTSGGTAVNGTGTYTRERLRQMMATPEGMDEYRRNRAEIERQEAAGLIR